MAYVLGLLFADGAIEDVRKSSRTCYICLVSTDKSLIIKVRDALQSDHQIYIIKPRVVSFKNGKSYLCAKAYCLRIGNKAVYQNLIDLGLTPRKSLVMKFPSVPKKYISYFIRGYFEGDGCVTIYKSAKRRFPRLCVIFTSGSSKFLSILSSVLGSSVGASSKRCLWGSKGAYDIRYGSKESLKILNFIYSNLSLAPFLNRKYRKYQQAKKTFSYLEV